MYAWTLRLVGTFKQADFAVGALEGPSRRVTSLAAKHDARATGVALTAL